MSDEISEPKEAVEEVAQVAQAEPDTAKPLTDEEFRDMLKDLYSKHQRSGIVTVSAATGGFLFSWIGMTTGSAIDLSKAIKLELLKYSATE